MRSIGTALTKLADKKASEQPQAPREVSYVSVLFAFFEADKIKYLFLFGFAMSLHLCYILNELKSFHWYMIWLYLIEMIPPVLIVFPFVVAFRVKRIIANGEVAYAKVDSVSYKPANPKFLSDAVENGLASGTWHFSNLEPFDFKIDTPWAKDITVGSRIRVLKFGRKVIPLKMIHYD